jgi:biotin carboxyl carrier protein
VLGCTTNLPLLQAVSRHPDFRDGRESTGWLQEHLPQLNAPLLSAPCLELLRSPGFREQLACALAGLARPLPGPAGRFAGQADPELRIGSALEWPPLRLTAEGGPWFRLAGPGLASCPEAAGGAGDGPTLRFAACRQADGTLAVALGGETLTLEDPLARLSHPAASGAASGPVLAPMAGKVLEVHVAPGDRVESGQLLFVLESMKMQFEISAPRAGRVLAVRVQAGQVLPGPEPLAELGE